MPDTSGSTAAPPVPALARTDPAALRVRVQHRAQALQATVVVALYALRDRFRQRVAVRAEAGDHTIQVVITVLAMALLAIAVATVLTGTANKWITRIKGLAP